MIVACAQMEARTIGDSASVWPVVEKLAEQAASARTDLLLFPEVTYPAYWLESAERYRRPDILRTPDVLERFSAIAARRGMWLAAGFVEERGAVLHNAAGVFDRRGRLVHVARKSFLWDCDNRWFAPGDSIQAFDSEFGRLGVLICADCRAPEISATLVADGAGMLLLPTAWVNASPVRGRYANVHPEFLVRARAMEFGVPYVCCSKSGREGDAMEYVGQSQIVSHEGHVVASAPATGQHLIVARINPRAPRSLDIDGVTARRILSDQPPFRPTEPGVKCVLDAGHGSEALFQALQQAGARVARLGSAELAGFAVPRRLALDGAQVLLVEGRIRDDTTLRARATENKVFLVAGDLAGVQIIVDPDGQVIHRETDVIRRVEIDLSRADHKLFTPETDIWQQRRVACYRFDGRSVSQAPAERRGVVCGS